MTGSLQVKNNKYYVVVRIPDKTGKLKQKWIATKTSKRSEAKAAMNRILADLEQSQAVYSHETPFVQWLDKWMDEKALKIESNTAEAYRINLNKHILPYFKPLKLKLSKVTTQHIQDYYTAKQREGLSASTLKKHHAIIRGALQSAYKRDLISKDPSDRVEVPVQSKQDRFKGTAYTVDQAKALSMAMMSDVMCAAILLALFYGLRRSEVCGLRWKDIDFKAKTLTVCNTRTRMLTQLEHEKTKSTASHRTLVLLENTIPMLQRIHREQLERRMLLGSAYIVSDYVCVGLDGKPFSPDYVSQHFQQFLKKNGLPKIRFHDLRHTAGSLLLASGATVKQVQEFLGHEQASTTLDIYTHTDIKSRQETAHIIETTLKIQAC